MNVDCCILDKVLDKTKIVIDTEKCDDVNIITKTKR